MELFDRLHGKTRDYAVSLPLVKSALIVRCGQIQYRIVFVRCQDRVVGDGSIAVTASGPIT
jgi:hypothetical protein